MFPYWKWQLGGLAFLAILSRVVEDKVRLCPMDAAAKPTVIYYSSTIKKNQFSCRGYEYE